MKLRIYLAVLALGLASQTAHGQLVITEAAATPGGANPTLQGEDWWELTNTGPGAVSLDGYQWVDRPVDNNQTAVFPNGISVASGESIVILRGTAATGTAFRSDWGLAPTVQVLTEDQFTGLNTFSGLGGSGELIHLYDGAPPTLGTANLLASAPTGPAGNGITHEWGTNVAGTLGRLSSGGSNGAITLGDGRVGSPGFATTTDPSNIFRDTFEISASNTDIGAELPGTRQSLATSGYTQEGGASIQEDPFGPGSGDWLTLTATNDTVPGAGNSVAVANLTTDFAPSVAGKKYTVSYTSRMDIPANGTADFWQHFGLGDSAPQGLFPNNSNTDFGILLRPNGDFSVFLDGANVANASGTGIVPGENFDIELLFDETVASPTVTATVSTSSGAAVLGTIPLGAAGSAFENASRFFELRTFVNGPAVTPGDLYTNRFDNLAINLVPEPTTGVLFSLACLICGAGRRERR